MIFDLIKVFGLVSLVVGAYFIFKSLKFNPSISVNFKKMSIGLLCIIVSVFCFFYTTKSHLEKVRDELRAEVIKTIAAKIGVEESLYNDYKRTNDVETYVGSLSYYDNKYDSEINGILKDIGVIENYLTRDNK